MTTIIFNRRANFDYEILEKYEAGLALFGHEVKSIKTNRASLKESFVTVHQNELYLTNAHIPQYKFSGIIPGYNPTRPRKLLVKKREIKHLIGKVKTQGLTLVPIRLYTKRRLIKLEFGLGKGKRQIDKRDKIKKREDERGMRRAFKNSR